MYFDNFLKFKKKQQRSAKRATPRHAAPRRRDVHSAASTSRRSFFVVKIFDNKCCRGAREPDHLT